MGCWIFRIWNARLRCCRRSKREVVLLVGIEGLTDREVTDVLGVPIGTVMSRLSRGREALRRIPAEPDTESGLVGVAAAAELEKRVG